MNEKKLTMKNYVEETPEIVLKNIDKSATLTETLVDEYLVGHFNKIVIVASGSSHNACVCAKPFMEDVLKVDVKVVPPFSFLHYTKEIADDEFVFVCSQSGRSTNSIDAINYLKSRNKKAIGLTGNVNSDFKDICDLLIDWGVGIEKVGYVTKGVVTLTLYLMLFAVEVQKQKGQLDEFQVIAYKKEMKMAMDAHIELQKETNEYIENHRKYLLAMNDVFILGANANYGTALEAALKIGETVKIHATAYEFEEFLHGPSFPLTPNHMVIMFSPNDSTKTRTNQIYKACKQVTDKVINIGYGDCDPTGIHTKIQLSELISPLAFLAVGPLLAQYPFGEFETKMVPLYRDFGKYVSIKTRREED